MAVSGKLVGPVLGEYWANVEDDGPKLTQHWDNASCVSGTD